MRRPHVSIENFEEVYKYHARATPKPGFTRPAFKFLNLIYSPDIAFNADTEEKVTNHLAENKRIILTPNHLSVHDPLVLASALQGTKAMRPMVRNTARLANAPMFNWPLVGWIFTNAGAIPTFRAKDINRSEVGYSIDALNTRRQEAARRVVNLAIERLNSGFNLSISPEGTRNKGDPAQLQTVRRGIGDIACGVDHPENLLLITAGIHYGKESKRTPAIVFDHVAAAINTPGQVVADIRKTLQLSVDRAVAMRS